jgi:sec-independent protein translocase protein TatB
VFDVSFSELLVIAVVALLVIGPEKLPKVARTLGALTGRMQRYVAQVKEEVNREARFEELQKLQQEVKESVLSVQNKTQAFKREIAAKTPRAKNDTPESPALRASQSIENNMQEKKRVKKAISSKSIRAAKPKKSAKA